MTQITVSDFSVDFTQASNWLGYESTSLALIDLKTSSLVPDVDYQIIGDGGVFPETALLTPEGFKKFTLEATTPKARAIQKKYVSVSDDVKMIEGDTIDIPEQPAKTQKKIIFNWLGEFKEFTVKTAVSKPKTERRFIIDSILGEFDDYFFILRFDGSSSPGRIDGLPIEDYDVFELVSESDGTHPRVRKSVKEQAFEWLRTASNKPDDLAQRIAKARGYFEEMTLDEALTLSYKEQG